MQNEELCPCKSGKTFGACCAPIIAGEKKAETAEQLMRARYASYVTGDVAFLATSATAATRDEYDIKSLTQWSETAHWHGLEIVSTEKGGPTDDEGVVEFRALYTANGQFCNHHERSVFVREGGEWCFKDGEMLPETPLVRDEPRIGRNDPCPCGSGKKYKKCCGREK